MDALKEGGNEIRGIGDGMQRTDHLFCGNLGKTCAFYLPEMPGDLVSFSFQNQLPHALSFGLGSSGPTWSLVVSTPLVIYENGIIALSRNEPLEVLVHAMVKERDGSRSPAPYVRLSGNSSENRVRKGYVPVLVGTDEAMMERSDVPTRLMGHPFVAALLELSANEFGYEQPGLLRILYDADCFKQMIRRISKRK